ncbi:MAG: hypothetical protein QM704_03725 [Anaeromyxobacteraceae bacterium]
MADPSTDPRGWLQACPELERFTAHPPVAAAVAKGDGFALFKALRARRRTGRGPGEERALDAILAKRRLFAMPTGSAPGLYTLNGIGTRMYGRSEEGTDGSYVGTLFFTFVFLPVWPIAQYLVSSEGAKYYFFGKVPISPTLRAWRLTVVALALVAAGWAGYGRWAGGRTQLVHLLNGLDTRVVVEAGGRRFDVAPREGELAVELPTGRVHVKASTEAGKPIEELDLEVPSYTKFVAYNVLGASPLVLEHVYYGPEPKGGGVPPRYLAGQRTVVIAEVDYVFQPAPASVQTSTAGAKRTRALIADGGWRNAVDHLRFRAKQPAEAERLARAVLAATPGPEAFDAAWELAYDRGGMAAALEVAEAAIAADPALVNAHRMRQEFLKSLGRQAEAQRLYRELEARSPDSALAAYLRARAEAPAEADRLFEAGLRRFPDDPNFLRAVAWTQLRAGRIAEAVDTWDRLEKVAPAEAAEMLEPRAVALATVGRGADATRLVALALDRERSYANALLYARVARFDRAPAHPPRHYLETIERQASPVDGAFLKVVKASVLGEPVPAASELAAIQEPEVRDGALLLLDALTAPEKAMRALAKASRAQARYVDATLRLMLAAEAARVDPALVEAIVGDIDGVPAFAELLGKFIRGEDPALLADLPFEHRTALLAGRARALEAAGKDPSALLAEIRRREAVPGIVTVALERWPKVMKGK